MYRVEGKFASYLDPSLTYLFSPRFQSPLSKYVFQQLQFLQFPIDAVALKPHSSLCFAHLVCRGITTFGSLLRYDIIAGHEVPSGSYEHHYPYTEK